MTTLITAAKKANSIISSCGKKLSASFVYFQQNKGFRVFIPLRGKQLFISFISKFSFYYPFNVSELA